MKIVIAPTGALKSMWSTWLNFTDTFDKTSIEEAFDEENKTWWIFDGRCLFKADINEIDSVRKAVELNDKKEILDLGYGARVYFNKLIIEKEELIISIDCGDDETIYLMSPNTAGVRTLLLTKVEYTGYTIFRVHNDAFSEEGVRRYISFITGKDGSRIVYLKHQTYVRVK